MKKFFTLCMCLLAGLAVQAQGFVFQYQGENLEEGDTIMIAAEEDMFGDLSCETNNPENPNEGLVLKLLRGTTASATATLQIIINDLNATTLQWCMGGACTQLGSQTSLTKQFTLEGSRQVQFDAVDIKSEGYLSATLKVTIGLESHQVVILFVNGDYTGIKEIKNEELKIKNEETVYDIQGRRVQGRPSSGVYIVKEGGHIRKVAAK